MNAAHFHLIVNHLPIILPLAGIIILIYGLVVKSDLVVRGAYLLFVLTALSAVIAVTSGEGAEEIVEHLNGVNESNIKIHEKASEVFAVFTYVLAGISLLGFWASYRQKSFSKIMTYVVLLFSFIVMFFAKQTGTSGGEIRHSEIRSNTNIIYQENHSEHYEDD